MSDQSPPSQAEQLAILIGQIERIAELETKVRRLTADEQIEGKSDRVVTDNERRYREALGRIDALRHSESGHDGKCDYPHYGCDCGSDIADRALRGDEDG